MTRQMKDSGVEWIGEVPTDWDIIKISRVTKSYSGGTPSRNNEKYWNNGDINWMSSGEVNNRVIYDTKEKITELGLNKSSARFFPINTIVVALNGQGKTKGLSAILKIKTTVNQSLVGFIAEENRLDYRYLDYCFITAYSYNRNYLAGGNKRDGIAAGDLKQSRIPFPKLVVQSKISDFLDEKTKEIENIIIKSKQAIEEYKRYKQAFITEAVTKGLDKSAPMKDSGIEWIGDIPESWNISKIKYFYNITLGKMLQNDQRTLDDTYQRYVSAVNIQNEVDLGTEKKMWFSANEKEMYKINKGDLLTVEGGHAGKSAIWEFTDLDDEYYFQNSILRARNKFNPDNRFLKYWMENIRAIGYMDYICNKATIAHYTQDKYLNTEIVVLDLLEQQEIADYLDEKTSQIDDIISRKEKLVEEMEAYKKSLIFETVTGKREVD